MKREYYFDYIRGLAIIMVVAIHCYPSNTRVTDGWIEVVTIAARNVMNCAVPLFLAISGYFISKRVKSNPDFNWKSFWKKQVPKVYVPCLIFSIPWLILDLYSGVSLWTGIIKSLLCGMSVYYFILLIICCYLAAPRMLKWKKSTLLILMTTLAFLSISVFTIRNSLRGGYLPLIVQGSIITFGLFFTLGLVLGYESRTYSMKWPLTVALLGLFLSIIETYYLQTSYGIVGVGQKASAFIFNIGVIFLCFCPTLKDAYKDSFFQRCVRWIGDISFGIYFTHVMLIWVFKRFSLHIMESWLLSTMVTLGATILIIIACKRIAPGFSNKYLGYR